MITETTTIRLSPFSKAELLELADRLKMNRSELIRDLVHETLAILQEREQKNKRLRSKAKAEQRVTVN